MLTLVRSELGLAFVPEPMARGNLARGRIVQLDLREHIPRGRSAWFTTTTAR